jgi:NitT/TauT family transport system substrate-binding protein
VKGPLTALLFSKKRLALALTVAVLIIAVILSSFVYLNSQNGYSGKNSSITFGNLHLETSALIYVAQKQGFFAQNRLNVTVKDYDTGVAAIDALLKGTVDIAGSAEYPLVRAGLQNQSVKTIAVINKSELQYLVARRDHGIENIFDLKGKTIALPQGTLSEFLLGRFLSLNGINMSDVTVVNMTLAQSTVALITGAIDELVNWQPYTNAINESLGSNAATWSIQSSQQSFGVMICWNDWIAQNPETVKQFITALAQAEDFTHNNPAAAKAIVKEQMNFTDTYMETVWKQNQFSLSFDQSLVGALDDEARWMISNHFTNETAGPNFLSYIYVDGLLSVKPESVNLLRWGLNLWKLNQETLSSL